MIGWRWCARWAGFVFLLVGAAVPPPLAAQVPAKQTTIIVNVNSVKADTFVIDQAPALIILSLGRDTTTAYRGAHLICGLSYVTKGAAPWSFAVRWAGDSLRSVVGTWRPLCLQ